MLGHALDDLGRRAGVVREVLFGPATIGDARFKGVELWILVSGEESLV